MSLLGKFFTMSPHLRLAVILAPMLLIGGFLVADFIETRGNKGERVHLLELADVCNLATSACQFRISEFTATLTASASGSGSRVKLETSEPIKAVNLEMLGQGGIEEPRAMTPDVGDLNKWYLDSRFVPEALTGVHMVISTGKVFLAGDANW